MTIDVKRGMNISKETYKRHLFSIGKSLELFRQYWEFFRIISSIVNVGRPLTIAKSSNSEKRCTFVKRGVHLWKEVYICEKRPIKETSFPLARASEIFEAEDE